MQQFFDLCLIIKATLSLEELWSIFNGAKWKTKQHIVTLCIYFNGQYQPNDAV